MPMTPQEKKLKSARTRALAAMSRSLRLITDETEAAAATLGNGGVPGGGAFQASVTRYENGLAVLAALDGITGGETVPDEEPDIPAGLREDIGTLVLFVQSLPEAQGMAGDSPLARLRQVAFPYQPADPDGEPS